MSYWYAYRVYNPKIDLTPGRGIIEGPFKTYDDAKSSRGNSAPDIQRTSIFPAENKDMANQHLIHENWSII